MMNSNVIFRSHLMQQFAATARSQSRPPIALSISSRSKTENLDPSTTSKPAPLIRSLSSNRHFESQRVFSTSNEASEAAIYDEGNEGMKRLIVEVGNQPQSQPLRGPLRNSQEHEEVEDGVVSIANSFQSLLSTRRTVSNFLSLKQGLLPALDRALICAQNAPNHKRTEPFVFKRLLTQSSIDNLSEIVFQVTLQRRMEKDPGGAEAFAEHKRVKWSQIPAYLVTLVEDQPIQDRMCDKEITTPFDELPFVAPQTERQLEDYASACAAVQNVLLSLHAEEIGTKWATGPIIKTSAFRQLIGAAPTDRVVALIMVGRRAQQRMAPRAPIRRKSRSELVQDL